MVEEVVEFFFLGVASIIFTSGPIELIRQLRLAGGSTGKWQRAVQVVGAWVFFRPIALVGFSFRSAHAAAQGFS